jgi:hypothetical protein
MTWMTQSSKALLMTASTTILMGALAPDPYHTFTHA